MKNYLYALAAWWGLVSCQPSSDTATSNKAQRIIDRAVATHGGDALQHVTFSFDFRKKHYQVQLDEGSFVYQSTVDDSIGRVHDVLTNQDFTRSVDGQPLVLDAEDQARYSNSLNSVVYFVLLPYPLNDPAVKKEYLGETTLQGEPYHKIQVTFRQEGGGDDFDDEYVYWIHQDQYTVDYLAYSFHVNGGGTRFREAYNVRTVGGIRFADYINYESTVADVDIENYDQLLEEGKVKELSRIETSNVEVQEKTKPVASV